MSAALNLGDARGRKNIQGCGCGSDSGGLGGTRAGRRARSRRPLLREVALRRTSVPSAEPPSFPIGEHLLILRAFAVRLVQCMGFDAAGTAFGCKALKVVVGDHCTAAVPVRFRLVML